MSRPHRSEAPARRSAILRGWESSLDGPVNNLVRAFACHLEAVAASGGKPATVTLYDGRYKQFLSYLKEQGHEPPFALELLNLELARRAALWVKDRSTGQRGGEHAMRMLVCVLKIGSAWLADEGYLFGSFDPLARLKRPRATSKVRLPFSQDEVRALVGASAFLPMGIRDVAIIHLMLDTGMRSGGVCSIELRDVDFVNRRVTLRLKGGREHALYFGSSERRDGGHTVRALRRYIDQRQNLVNRWLNTTNLDRSRGRLFLSYDGRPLSPAGFHQSLARLAEGAGLTGVFPHRFRHTFATMYLIRNPGDETGLRAILGHLSPDMFANYVHMAHEIVAERAGRVSLSEAWLGDEPRHLQAVGTVKGPWEGSGLAGKPRQQPARVAPDQPTRRRGSGSQ